MRPLKLPRADAPLNAIIAYLTDVGPLLVEHRAYFTEHHADGEAFASTLIAAGSDVLARSTAADLQGAEAENATAAQSAEMARARALIDEVRRRGRYLIGELSRRPDPESQANARAVRIACAIGARLSVSNQTGLRKLLALQRAGLDEVQAVFDAFKQPDLRPRLRAASEGLDRAIQSQAKEQNEAEVAEEHLEAAVDATVDALRRAVRLMNAMGEDVPLSLRTGFRSLEGRHPAVFHASRAEDEVLEPA